MFCLVDACGYQESVHVNKHPGDAFGPSLSLRQQRGQARRLVAVTGQAFNVNSVLRVIIQFMFAYTTTIPSLRNIRLLARPSYQYYCRRMASEISNDKPIYFWRETEVPYGFLSQWYESPFEVDGVTYQTPEMWMMIHKAKVFGDEVRCRTRMTRFWDFR